MNAREITEFRRHLQQNNPENWENRRVFHENYEWLEGYWRSDPHLANFDGFCAQRGAFFGSDADFVTLARQLAAEGVVGNSRNSRYRPTQEVTDATSRLANGAGTPKEIFKDTMIIVRQIRNNLFHGRKMELADGNQYERNKRLVRLARLITDLVQNRLEEVEL